MPHYTKKNFDNFIEKHPEAYDLFERRAVVAYNENPIKGSQWDIATDIRRHDKRLLPRGLPNGAIAHLARMFNSKHPDKTSLFTLRPLK